jgi:hypothetical protein
MCKQADRNSEEIEQHHSFLSLHHSLLHHSLLHLAPVPLLAPGFGETAKPSHACWRWDFLQKQNTNTPRQREKKNPEVAGGWWLCEDLGLGLCLQ